MSKQRFAKTFSNFQNESTIPFVGTGGDWFPTTQESPPRWKRIVRQASAKVHATRLPDEKRGSGRLVKPSMPKMPWDESA